MGLGGGQGSVGEGTAVCCVSGTVLMLTLFLFSLRLPLTLPPLLLHSPLRPLLATAGFLQLRLSLCVLPLVLASLVHIRDCGALAVFPLPLEHTHSSPSL